VAGAAEGVAHRLLGTRKHVRVAAHIAGDEHRLTDGAVFRRQFCVSGRKGGRCVLSMDAQPPLAPIDDVRLEFGDVVRDFIDGAPTLAAVIASAFSKALRVWWAMT
jgi:hypothetical protein